MSSLKEEDALQWIGTTYWCIWNRRNSVMWRNICWNEAQVIDSTNNALIDWKNAKETTSTRIVCRRWVAPRMGTLKCKRISWVLDL